MSTLELTSWRRSPDIDMKLSVAVPAPFDVVPETPDMASPNPVSFHLSPVESEDSGCPSRSNSYCNSRSVSSVGSPSNQSLSDIDEPCSPRPIPVFTSQKLLACGGPGFSLGIVDCELGQLERMSVPMPEIVDGVDFATFPLLDIVSMSVVGESQLWIGTESGTLHVFELSAKLRLSQHTFLKINEPILCITSRPMERVFNSSSALSSQGPQTEVLLGIPHGYAVILQGSADDKGRLRDVAQLPRKVRRFSNAASDCAVRCIIHVMEEAIETYWCSCGGSIFVLASTDLRVLHNMDARVCLPTSAQTSRSKEEVLQLLDSELGVWSVVSMSSTAVLWSKEDHTPMLHITCCEFHHSLALRPDVSVLHFSYDLLFVGTVQGDLIVFKIKEATTCVTSSSPPRHTQDRSPAATLDHRQSTPVAHQHSYKYSFAANAYCGPHPIVALHTSSPKRGQSYMPDSPLLSPTTMNILVVCGESYDRTGSSQLCLFELMLSPPTSLCSTPLPSSCPVSATFCSSKPLPRSMSVLSSSSAHYLPLHN